jgi:hypothetical protein
MSETLGGPRRDAGTGTGELMPSGYVSSLGSVFEIAEIGELFE